MKTNGFKVMLPIFAVIFIFTAVSCNDDAEDERLVDPDIIEVDAVPEKDVIGPRINRTAFLLTPQLNANDDKAMADNFIARYAVIKPFQGNETIDAGDALAFDSATLRSAINDEASAQAVKNAYKAGAVLLLSAGNRDDFAALCNLLGCANPYEGITEEFPAVNGNKLLWVISGELPGLSEVHTVLSAYMPAPDGEETEITDEEGGSDANLPPWPNGEDEQTEGGFISDYMQGVFCQQVADGINEALVPPVKDPNVDDDELTHVMKAKKIYLSKSSAWTYKGEKRPSYYTVELDIWNAYSNDEQRHYYYIHQEMTYAFAETCVGSFHNNGWKSYGKYGKYYQTSFYNVEKPGDVIFHRLSPGTTQSSKEYTSTVSYNIGGSVSTQSIGFSGGVNISNTEKYTIDDVTIDNYSIATGDASKASWRFDMRDAKGHFNWLSYASVDIDPCSLSGRSTFNCGADYIFSVPKNFSNKWQLDLFITKRLTNCYSVFSRKPMTKHYDTKKAYQLTITLPVVTQ